MFMHTSYFPYLRVKKWHFIQIVKIDSLGPIFLIKKFEKQNLTSLEVDYHISTVSIVKPSGIFR